MLDLNSLTEEDVEVLNRLIEEYDPYQSRKSHSLGSFKQACYPTEILREVLKVSYDDLPLYVNCE